MKKTLQILFSVLTIGLILLFFHTVATATELATSDMENNNKILSEYAFKNIEKAVQSDAAQTTTSPDKATTTIQKADKLTADMILIREKHKFWAVGFLLVGMMISLFCVLYFVMKTHHCADDIVHASGLVLLIFGTIILVIMLEVDQQLTAAMGILGAIAGYLFGSLRRGEKPEVLVSQEGKK
jgi:hypothetical protein